MKKNAIAKRMTALLMAAALLATTGLYAQEQQSITGNGLSAKFGIKGGFNFTNLYSNDVSTDHMKVAWDAGIFAKLPITQGFSIQPELLYSDKGAKDSYSNFAQGSGEYRFNLNYIELPLLAVVNLSKNFNIHAGPYAAYLVSANVKNVDNNGNIEGATDLNADNFNRWDFGLAGGAAIDISAFTLGARYNYGLTKIGKSGNLSGDLTGNSKNAGLSVYVGFAF